MPHTRRKRAAQRRERLAAQSPLGDSRPVEVTGEEAVVPLLNQMQDMDPKQRAKACRIIGLASADATARLHLVSNDVVSRLHGRLTDPILKVRVNAMEALNLLVLNSTQASISTEDFSRPDSNSEVLQKSSMMAVQQILALDLGGTCVRLLLSLSSSLASESGSLNHLHPDFLDSCRFVSLCLRVLRQLSEFDEPTASKVARDSSLMTRLSLLIKVLSGGEVVGGQGGEWRVEAVEVLRATLQLVATLLEGSTASTVSSSMWSGGVLMPCLSLVKLDLERSSSSSSSGSSSGGLPASMMGMWHVRVLAGEVVLLMSRLPPNRPLDAFPSSLSLLLPVLSSSLALPLAPSLASLLDLSAALERLHQRALDQEDQDQDQDQEIQDDQDDLLSSSDSSMTDSSTMTDSSMSDTSSVSSGSLPSEAVVPVPVPVSVPVSVSGEDEVEEDGDEEEKRMKKEWRVQIASVGEMLKAVNASLELLTNICSLDDSPSSSSSSSIRDDDEEEEGPEKLPSGLVEQLRALVPWSGLVESLGQSIFRPEDFSVREKTEREGEGRGEGEKRREMEGIGEESESVVDSLLDSVRELLEMRRSRTLSLLANGLLHLSPFPRDLELLSWSSLLSTALSAWSDHDRSTFLHSSTALLSLLSSHPLPQSFASSEAVQVMGRVLESGDSGSALAANSLSVLSLLLRAPSTLPDYEALLYSFAEVLKGILERARGGEGESERVGQVLDAVFDLLAEPEVNQKIYLPLDFHKVLEGTVPVLGQRLSDARRAHDLSLVDLLDDAKTNLLNFISYKRQQF